MPLVSAVDRVVAVRHLGARPALRRRSAALAGVATKAQVIVIVTSRRWRSRVPARLAARDRSLFTPMHLR